jgi:serine/threonine-protein kinase
MTMTPGTKLGPYVVTTPLGAGGMGEVWRARDTRLHRDVAVKILPDAFAHDADRLARFEREARTLASLNHPNIAQVYGLEESRGDRPAAPLVQAIVMELVEGPTLADRIAQGPIPLDDALPIAKQIADALESAHEEGIVHRDLKPANVKLRPDGTVKVLDFGLAKAVAAPGADVDVSQSPTLTVAATQQGIVLGTAAYMSPEQAKGRATDRRTDIWAFGCLLYEMLTGRAAFEGEDVSEILASVISGGVDLDSLPARIHPRLRRLLARCLEKNPKRRFRDIGDVLFELDELIAGAGDADVRLPAATTGLRARWLVSGVAAGVLAAAVLGAAAGWLVRPEGPPPVNRIVETLPEGHRLAAEGQGSVAVSPDGRAFVYATTDGLYLRRLTPRDPVLIRGTEGISRAPVFSPDGAWIGYFDGRDRQLKRVPIGGGLPYLLAAVDPGIFRGWSWGSDGTIVMSLTEGIFSLPEYGGTPSLIVAAEGGEEFDHPRLLPGGEWVLFSVTSATGPGRWDQAEVVVASLVTSERKVLIRGGSDARYVPTGHLVYAQEFTLFAVPFDLGSMELPEGVSPVPVVAGVQRPPSLIDQSGTAHYDLSPEGTLVHVRGDGAAITARTLGLADRAGQVERLPLRPLAYFNPRISVDGQVAVEAVGDDGTSAVWVLAPDTDSASRRLTLAGNSGRPVWTPDGKWVTFTSNRDGAWSIWRRRADGSGDAERLTTAADGEEHWPTSWHPDGRTFAFTVVQHGDPGTAAIWTLSLDGTGEPQLF